MKSAEQPLTDKRYAKLLKDVSTLLSTADSAAASDKIDAYYQVGARLKKEGLTQKAGYHNSVLRDIATDTRIAVRSLQRAVVFFESYPRGVPKTRGLTWTHIRVLLTVSDPKERARYLLLAAEEGLNARELAALLHAPITEDESTLSLTRPTESEYLYRAQVIAIIDGDTIDVEIDLGFQIKREQRVRLAAINAQAITTKAGRAAKRTLTASLLKAGTVVLKTERIDQHGRYVAHIFTTPGKASIHQCFTNGTYINEALLQAEAARIPQQRRTRILPLFRTATSTICLPRSGSRTHSGNLRERKCTSSSNFTQR